MPKDQSTQLRWRENIADDLPTHARVCELHFEESDFTVCNGNKRLKMGRAPTLQQPLLEVFNMHMLSTITEKIEHIM